MCLGIIKWENGFPEQQNDWNSLRMELSALSVRAVLLHAKMAEKNLNDDERKLLSSEIRMVLMVVVIQNEKKSSVSHSRRINKKKLLNSSNKMRIKKLLFL